MSKYPKVFRKGKLVSKSKSKAEADWRGSAAPYVISDNMDGLKHHGTGKITDSKSQFRRMTKDAGCVEVGNETIKPRKPIPLDRRQRKEDIAKVIYQLKNQ